MSIIGVPEYGAGFSDADRQAAGRALHTYNHEIFSAGLRWTFHQSPDTMPEFMERLPGHHMLNSECFAAQVQRVGGMVTDLAGLQSRPITHYYPLGRLGPGLALEDPLQVDPLQVKTYRRFHTALAGYERTIMQLPDLPGEIERAANAVAACVQPDAWRQSEYAPPSDAPQLTSGPTLLFLKHMLLGGASSG